MYNPVLAWANQQFDVKFVVSHSIFGAPQQPETHEAVRQFLQGMQLGHASCAALAKFQPKALGTHPALTAAQVLASQVLS